MCWTLNPWPDIPFIGCFTTNNKRGFIHDIFALMFNFLYYLIVYLQDGYFPQIFSGKNPSKSSNEFDSDASECFLTQIFTFLVW